MRSLTIACSIYLSIAIQSSTFLSESPANGRLFLPALVVMLISCWSRGSTALLWAALVGLLLDGLSLGRLGVQMSLAVVIAWALQSLIENGWMRSTASWLALAFVTTLVWRAASPLTYGVLEGRTVDLAVTLVSATSEAAVTTVLAGLLVYGSHWLLNGSTAEEHSNSGLGNRWSMLTE